VTCGNDRSFRSTEQMGGYPIAFADWWRVDEEGARAHAARVIEERRGDLRGTYAELGVRYASAVWGASRTHPWAVFLREETRRVREMRAAHRRVIPETRVSDRGMMGGR
jgi:hypothetical protein